jgi:hypothetical protein
VYDDRVCNGLAEAIEELLIPIDGEALAGVLALRDRLDARIAVAIASFDRHQLWDTEGASSMTAWLVDRAGLTRRHAAHTAARARRLDRLPVTTDAWRTGRLSGGQVDTIVANVSDEKVDLFAAQEAELVPVLEPLTIRATGRAMGVWRALATADGSEAQHADRALHLSPTLDGTGILDGTLSSEGYALVKKALELAETPDVDGEPTRTPAQRRHDALVDLSRYFLDHQHTNVGGRHRPHLNVVVDLDALESKRGGQVVDGPGLDGVTVGRLLCDSALHRVVMAGRSSVLDYGTSTRTIPVNLWNAVVVRDEGCRWPGCDRPPGWCEAHHVQWFSDGGSTSIDNLVALCSRHHHRLHQPGWDAKLRPNGSFRITDPNGAARTSHPPGALVPMLA